MPLGPARYHTYVMCMLLCIEQCRQVARCCATSDKDVLNLDQFYLWLRNASTAGSSMVESTDYQKFEELLLMIDGSKVCHRYLLYSVLLSLGAFICSACCLLVLLCSLLCYSRLSLGTLCCSALSALCSLLCFLLLSLGTALLSPLLVAAVSQWSNALCE